MIKQNKFSLIDFSEPKKLAAAFIFLLAFLAFMGQLLGAFQGVVQVETVFRPTTALNNQVSLKPDTALFSTALFGEYIPANLSDDEIKQSMLDAQVVGIMFSAKGKESQAIIRLGGGEEKSYLIGDTLPGGAIIKRISERRVVVLHNGALESLSLPKNELTFDAPAKPLIKE